MNVIEEFEETIADYCGSKYAVATNTGTDALFLSLLYLKENKELKCKDEIILPKQTYHQVARSILRAGFKIKFEDIEWWGSYQLKPTRIYDSALVFQKDMYIPDSLCCLSFNYRKTLPIGKGGMILLDSKEERDWFVEERYNRYMYMTDESASRGMSLFVGVTQKKHGYVDYPDLSKIIEFK